jgi:lipoyl(octanoyl) transferase
VIIKDLGLSDYQTTYEQMRAFNAARNVDTPDEIWLTEHPAVYTLGLAGKPEHLLNVGNVPVVQTDRGGQVTFHNPGQAVVYLFIDLRRKPFGVKELVRRIEQAVIDCLAHYGIQGERQTGMPGVYVAGAKIAALGLRVSRHCTYHGLALNVNNDLTPFLGINPCGYAGLETQSLAKLGVNTKMLAVQQFLASRLQQLIAE